MYESEIYSYSISQNFILELSLDKINNLRNIVAERSLIRWAEHCTECAYPDCYSSCALYSPREDGKCSRFVNGFEKLQFGQKHSEYFTRIGFKQWGKLSGVFSGRLYNVDKSETKEKSQRKTTNFIKSAPPGNLRKILQQLYAGFYRISEKVISLKKKSIPRYFIIEYYYPGEKLLDFTLTIYPENKKQRNVIYNKRVIFTPEYNLVVIDYNEINNVIGNNFPLRVSLTPNNTSPDDLIYFGLVEFVNASPEIIRLEKVFKCVIFDLDNTLWDDTLVETRREEISIPGETISILKKLDEAGILLSIASKNNADDVIPILKHHDIHQFFLHPQINWNPKSISVSSISKELNLHPDSFIFIDDSKFERTEVKNNFPMITTIHPDSIHLLPQLLTLKKDLTHTPNRRKFYQEEQLRKETNFSFKGDYIEFLKSCELEITLENLNVNNYNRVFELTQRTNQLNYSGTIYDNNKLTSIQQDMGLSKFVVSAKDKFGDYGAVGFVLFNQQANTIKDMMFSCRIMGKKLESEVIAFIRNNFGDISRDFIIKYVPTKKNTPARLVLEELHILHKIGANGESNYYIEPDSVMHADKVAKVFSRVES